MTRRLAGAAFHVIDPSTYPYGHTTFDEAEPIQDQWARFGSGDLVVDIGAAFGSFTMPALARGCRVWAFEPSEDGGRILQANIDANGWRELASVVNLVLWDDKTIYPAKLWADVFERSYPIRGRDAETECTTLDTILAHSGPIKCIKLDVEGAEWHVLQGGRRLLEEQHPMLLIEDHDGIAPGEIVSDYPASIDSSKRIHSMLHDLGYVTTVLPFGSGRKYIVAEVPR